MTSLPVLQNHFRILIISSSSSLLQSALFDLKDAEIKDQEAEMILQTGSDVIAYPDCSQI